MAVQLFGHQGARDSNAGGGQPGSNPALWMAALGAGLTGGGGLCRAGLQLFCGGSIDLSGSCGLSWPFLLGGYVLFYRTAPFGCVALPGCIQPPACGNPRLIRWALGCWPSGLGIRKRGLATGAVDCCLIWVLDNGLGRKRAASCWPCYQRLTLMTDAQKEPHD